MDATRKRDMVFLILQLLNEKRFKGSLHKLECESGCFFNQKYLNELILDGNWKEVETYLSYFTKTSDPKRSARIYFNICYYKYLETLDVGALDEAHKILVHELNHFSNDECWRKELIKLLNKDSFRAYKERTKYNIQTNRKELVDSLSMIFRRSPIFQDKLSFPEFGNSRLQSLISQSLSWQHSMCPNPAPQPDFLSLYTDHRCPNTRVLPSARNTVGAKPISVPWTIQTSVSSLAQIISGAGQRAGQLERASKELPKLVARTLDQGSSIASMEFNPVHSMILLAGTTVGDVAVWEVDSGKMILETFQLWNIESLSPELMLALEEAASVSVCCLRWNSEGTLFGVAYSKHIVQLFSCLGIDKITRHKEINAHIGRVNDLAFTENLLITCGDDGKIKVWETMTSFQLLRTIEGHEAPVYSLCALFCNNMHLLISHSLDGKINVWSDHQSSGNSTYFIPGGQCTTKSYSAYSKRLFSSGKSEHGKPYILEWNLVNGQRKIRRSYRGLQTEDGENLHFDVNKSRILAAGDHHEIKFWDMENGILLNVCDAEGGLPDAPVISFNKEGDLLAVSTNDNSIKILATIDGMKLLQTRKVRCHASSANTASTRSKEQVGCELSLALLPEKRPCDQQRLKTKQKRRGHGAQR